MCLCVLDCDQLCGVVWFDMFVFVVLVCAGLAYVCLCGLFVL